MLFSVTPKVYASSAFVFYLETILFPTGGRNTLRAKQCCQFVPFCLYNGIVLQNIICMHYVVTQNGMVYFGNTITAEEIYLNISHLIFSRHLNLCHNGCAATVTRAVILHHITLHNVSLNILEPYVNSCKEHAFYFVQMYRWMIIARTVMVSIPINYDISIYYIPVSQK